MTTKRMMKITPARFDPEFARSRYYHPNGWTITQREREPMSRVGRMNGQADHPGSMRWWEIKRSFYRAKGDGVVEVFNTLRESRVWCDENRAGSMV